MKEAPHYGLGSFRMIEIDIALPTGPEAPARAREAIGLLAASVSRERIDDVLLMTNELVTNSVRHARLETGDRIYLHASATDDLTRVEVSDPGGENVPQARPPKDGGRSGWGLLLVSHLATRWGVERGSGTMVWFELQSQLAGGLQQAIPGKS